MPFQTTEKFSWSGLNRWFNATQHFPLQTAFTISTIACASCGEREQGRQNFPAGSTKKNLKILFAVFSRKDKTGDGYKQVQQCIVNVSLLFLHLRSFFWLFFAVHFPIFSFFFISFFFFLSFFLHCVLQPSRKVLNRRRRRTEIVLGTAWR